MRRAGELLRERAPDLSVEGEMRGDAALSQTVLDIELPDSGFASPANVLVMPNLDAANISYNLLRMTAGRGVTVGGITARRGEDRPRAHPLFDGTPDRQHGGSRRRGRFAAHLGLRVCDPNWTKRRIDDGLETRPGERLDVCLSNKGCTMSERYFTIEGSAKLDPISERPKKLRYAAEVSSRSPRRQIHAVLQPLHRRGDRLCAAMHGRGGGRSDPGRRRGLSGLVRYAGGQAGPGAVRHEGAARRSIWTS